MKRYPVMASVFNNLCEQSCVRNIYWCPEIQHTPIHIIECEYIDELPDLFVNAYGHECDMLGYNIYFYAFISDKWHRIPI